jgi:hypothetical protein
MGQYIRQIGQKDRATTIIKKLKNTESKRLLWKLKFLITKLK